MPTDGELAADLLARSLSVNNIELQGLTKSLFALYADMLIDWNSNRFNLTRLISPEQIALNHFVDSLSVTQLVKIPLGATVVDIGTGAGFPGLALKIYRPDIKLILVESTAKKLSFCRAVTEAARLDQVEFIHGRAEDPQVVKEIGGSGAIVTARAVAQMKVLLNWSVPFLAPKGIFVAWKGSKVFEEVGEAEATARHFGMQMSVAELKLSLFDVEPITHYYVVCKPYR